VSETPTSQPNDVRRPTSGTTPGTHTPRILVADAEVASLHARRQQLEASGVHAVVARTSFEAIVKAACLMPDLVVLADSLGELEVAETARLLAECPATARTPVIRVRRGRRVPQRVLARLRRQVLV
jgi:CheY-like chemotaxis protein